MQKSDAINELATALSKAQAEFKGAAKDSTNPFYKSKYADLESCWSAIREPLTKNGLSIVQTTEVGDAGLTVLRTTLLHSSGQWISGVYPLYTQKNEPQAIGSAVSYARRYALAAITGLYQVDDDAESATSRTPYVNKTYEKPKVSFTKKPDPIRLGDEMS